jgi:uncharacterized membrane protein
VLAALLSSLGLALPAGLNAWLPFLILALADRFSSTIDLNAPYDFISSTPGIIIILLLLPIELVADKVPGLDHVSDIVHTAIRPVAGAILAAAVADASGDLDAWIGALIGVTGAGATHAAKMSTRPVVTVSTGGVGNPIVSMIEDVTATISSLVAVFLPLLLLIVLPVVGFLLYGTWRRMRRGSARLRAVVSRGS